MSNDPRINPNNAPIWEDDHNAAYANRSISAIFGFVFLIALIGAASFWALGYFSAAPPSKNVIVTQQGTTAPLPEQADQSTTSAATAGDRPIYDFFYSLFNSASNGADSAKMKTAKALTVLEDNAKAIADADTNDGYRHSIKDVVGSDVVDKDGDQFGRVHDIVVNKKTGEGMAVIVDGAGEYHESQLSSLSYKNVLMQDSEGSVLMTVTGNAFQEKDGFEYTNMDNDKFISLRLLHGGQLLDDLGEVAGDVDAVIYQNAEAQKIYFVLDTALSPNADVVEFSLPFTEVNIIKNPDGYDVKMTKAQTEKLAQLLFTQGRKND